MGFGKSSAKREAHGNTSLPQETRETLNKQPNFTPKATRKSEKNPEVSRRNHENQSRNIVKKKRRRLYQKSTKVKAGFLRR